MNNNNDNDNNLDQIRPPDPVKRETLIEQFDNFNNMYNNNFDNNFEDIDDNYNQYDIEFHRALQLSRDEYEIVAQQTENERHQRLGTLLNIKQRLLRVKGFDMDNNKIYEMIISIIEMYETEKINTFGVDKENYTAFFNVTKLVRFDQDEIELLKDIIVQL